MPGFMPVRATKRGSQRTPLSGSWDVLICGASFAGLAVARELRGSGARVLIVDRYEVGERQTSACAAPTAWLENLGLADSIRQTFRDLVIHTPARDFRWRLPFTFSTFDYPQLCALLRAQGDAEFETSKVDGRTGLTVHTDRGDLTAPLIVDALGWRRVLSPAQPGIQPTVRLAGVLDVPAVRYQGNWIPHQMRRPVEDGVFFAGDSAGHCLPTTAEGIRTALYFGLACGRELRGVVDGRQDGAAALARYAAFCDRHERAFRWLLRVQGIVSRVN